MSKHLIILLWALFAFSFCQAQNRYDIIITEIMADPTPLVGLPDAEWIEVMNRSNSSINLSGLRLAKASGNPSGPMPAYLLQPDSMVIICTASQVAALSVFGKAISVTSFPSLSNGGDLISIQNTVGETIHAVKYSDRWYKNDLKQEGGWSLEMMDITKPCLGIENWKASIDNKGGSPGKTNSVAAAIEDNNAPWVTNVFPATNQQIEIHFNEPIATASLGNAVFSIAGGPAILQAKAQPPIFDIVTLDLAAALSPGKFYQLNIGSTSDCAGNLSNDFKVDLALPTIADSLDVIINEILFDPKSPGVDYIELYNRSQQVFNLSQLYLANRNSAGSLASLVKLSDEPRLFFPGTFLTFTTDTTLVKAQYYVLHPGHLFSLASMPSFPNDKGFAVIVNQQGKIIDELNYSDKWHFALIDNKEGVALERLQYDAKTNETSNWTSAAASSGFGTPTAENSQRFINSNSNAKVSVQPKVFSPDNDGFYDYCMINIEVSEPRNTVNITIYDALGRAVRTLQRNATIANKASFRWDGLNDNNTRLNPGNYIALIDIFNIKGKREKIKTVITLAQKNR